MNNYNVCNVYCFHSLKRFLTSCVMTFKKCSPPLVLIHNKKIKKLSIGKTCVLVFYVVLLNQNINIGYALTLPDIKVMK